MRPVSDYDEWEIPDTVATCPDCGATVTARDRTLGDLLAAIDDHECDETG